MPALVRASSEDDSVGNIMKNKVGSLGSSDNRRERRIQGRRRHHSLLQRRQQSSVEIDPQAAEHADLKISSKLLKLARIFTR